MYVSYWLFLWRTPTNPAHHSETVHTSSEWGLGFPQAFSPDPCGQHAHPGCAFSCQRPRVAPCGSSLLCVPSAHQLCRRPFCGTHVRHRGCCSLTGMWTVQSTAIAFIPPTSWVAGVGPKLGLRISHIGAPRRSGCLTFRCLPWLRPA